MSKNRVQQLIGETGMFKPVSDYLSLKKHEIKSVIHTIHKQDAKEILFEVIDSGPGRWEFGIFIPNKLKKGDKIFIVGQVGETVWDGKVAVVARERDVVGMWVE